MIPESESDTPLPNAILEMILNGDFKPGDKLTETDLATRLGVSRSPIRVALRSLEKTGVVTVQANRGARVTTYTSKDVANIYAARSVLEPLVATLAMDECTDDDLEELTSIADRIDAEIQSSANSTTIAQLNNVFHNLLLSKCQNSYLVEAASGLLKPLVISRTFKQYTPDELQRSSQHHYEIIEAIRNRDPVWLNAIMTAHIRFGSYSSQKLAKLE